MSATEPSPGEQRAVSEKRAQRSVRWELNKPLLIKASVALVSLSLLFGVLYWRQSSNLAGSILAKANQAEQAQDWQEQLRWLNRYRMLKPNDVDAVVALAAATERAVEAPPANRLDRVDRSRRALRDALAALRKAEAPREQIAPLQRQLIARLLQFGIRYADEVERQILDLRPAPEDPVMMRAMALSLARQATNETVTRRDPEKYLREQEYWLWFSQQPLGIVLQQAWQANPEDLTLAALLIDQCVNHPDHFLVDDEPVADADPQTLVQQVVQRLAAKQDNGQAQWIVYGYERMTAPENAVQRLALTAGPALQRLQAYAAEQTQDESGDEASANAAPVLTLPPATPTDQYRPQWDYELVLQHAVDELGDATDQPPSAPAVRELDQLIALPLNEVSAQAIESTYLARGQAALREQQQAQAWQFWSDGIERLGDQSLRLQLSHAGSLAADGEIAAAVAATTKLADLLRRRSLAVAGPEGAKLSPGQRLLAQKELDQATWTVQLLRGQTTLRQDQPRAAISLLQSALDSQLTVEDAQRTSAAVLVATAYERVGSWDLAATAYERAVNLSPADDQYRAAAARAWANAGNNDLSTRQWQSIDGNSLPLLLARAQAIVSEQMTRPPASRDFRGLSRGLTKLRQLIEQVPDDQREKVNLQAQLELLALAIPDSAEGQERAAGIERLAELADRFPASPELQSVAALSLAAAGQPERAETALQRLRGAAGEDSARYQQTKARIQALQGQSEQSIQTLVTFAQTHPDQAAESLVLAADLAQVNGQPARTYELLQQIPADQQSPDQLFRLFTLSQTNSQQATEETTSGQDAAGQITPVQWEERLRELEGEGGTWWRLARATRLLSQWDRLNPNDPQRGKRMQQAEILQAEIRNRRPRWGLAWSLEGQIAARQGQTNVAIERLRRGIDGGDRRMSTLLLLVSQLTTAGRTDEADLELSRFARLTETNSTLASLAIAIAEKKGDFTQGLELARASAKNSPRDISSWLLLGQTAAIAARSLDATDDAEPRDALIQEAQAAYDQALKLSQDSSLAAYQLRIRLQAAFFGVEQVRAELQQALRSNIAEPARSLLVGATYLQIQDAESALPVLVRAQRIAPDNPDVYLVMADYHRLVRDDAQSIAMLEKAFEVDSTRLDVRNRLALAIALRDGAEVPWKRLDQLLKSDSEQASPNQLLHALILINRGDEQRQNQAVDILRELIRRGDQRADDAMRMLAALERRRWAVASQDPQSTEARRALSEARRLYGLLTRRDNPAVMDLYRYADLLLRAEQTSEVPRLADQLDALASGSPIGLDVRLRLAKQTGQEQEASRLAKQWAAQAIESGSLLQVGAWETAGQTLSKLGFHEQALEWLEQAYDENEENFRAFVVGLARGRQFRRALEICQTHYKATQQPDAVALMADVVIISGSSNEVPANIEAIFQSSLKRYSEDPRLVESIATLRLSQQRYPEAVVAYERAEQLAPKNVRVLNNLAMALSEIPGREKEALPRIQKAIDLYGRSPELLDTQGLVLLRNDRVAEAVKILREATAGSDDPRYRFHLLMALMRSGENIESRAQWAQLDIKALKQSVLTPAEQRDLSAMQDQFAPGRT